MGHIKQSTTITITKITLEILAVELQVYLMALLDIQSLILILIQTIITNESIHVQVYIYAEWHNNIIQYDGNNGEKKDNWNVIGT